MKFSEKHAVSVIFTLKKFRLFSSNTFVLNTISLLHEYRQNFTKLATPHIVYYGESHMKYTTYCGESMLHRSFTARSQNFLCRLLRWVSITSGELIMKI